MKTTTFLDFVICGPDMSGTSTQIDDFIKYFNSLGKKIRDIRGTEIDLLFHAEIFKEYNKDFISFKEFISSNISSDIKNKVLFEIYSLLSGINKQTDLLVGSFKKTNHTTYIDPESADVWILEEPTKRGAGQVSRVIEQNRSFFDFKELGLPIIDGLSATFSHQAYRTDEFFRIRKILREKNKIIIRSRSEESACYQIYDTKKNPNGIKLKQYLQFPGHQIAFKYPPTHLFVVCGPKNWGVKKYLELKKQRSSGRILDDHELNTEYQLLVNKRYASDWLENLYKTANNSNLPVIYRFNIYDSKEEIKKKMHEILDKII